MPEVNTLLATKDNNMVYESGTDFKLSSDTFYYRTTVLNSLNLTIPSTLTNAIVRFETGSNFTYTITYDSNMDINKTILFESSKKYILSVNKTLILWQEVMTAY